MSHRIKNHSPRARAIRFGLLRDWYGEEAARTEIAAHTQQSELLADALDRVMSSLEKQEISDYVKLTQNWSGFCGEALAKYLTPEGMIDGVLTVTVPHSGLLSMISPSIELIQSKINDTFGQDFCKEIRLISGGRKRK